MGAGERPRGRRKASPNWANYFRSKAFFVSRDFFWSPRDIEFVFFFLKYALNAFSSSAVNEPKPPIKSKSDSVFFILILLIFEVFVY